MSRVELNEENLGNVTGGSIVFNADHTTCGLNCNNQAKVNDYDACLKFIGENMYTMGEKEILRALVEKGYITRM